MGDNSTIQWLADSQGRAGASWNPIRALLFDGQETADKGSVGWHCEHVDDGCANCYSERINQFRGTGLPFKPGHLGRDVDVFLDEKTLVQPLRWQRGRVIFPCSMTDLAARFVDEAWIIKMWAVMAMTPRHRYMVLTKRIDRLATVLLADDVEERIAMAAHDLYTRTVKRPTGNSVGSARWGAWADDDGFKDPTYELDEWPLRNVMVGTSASDEATWIDRRDGLMNCPAHLRWVSLEPLVGQPPVLFYYDDDCCALRGSGVQIKSHRNPSTPDSPPESVDCSFPWLDLVVSGGESADSRSMARYHFLLWQIDLRNQCALANVPFFLKQLGSWPVDAQGKRFLTRDRHGRDPAEWPEDLRVRQMPDGWLP